MSIRSLLAAFGLALLGGCGNLQVQGTNPPDGACSEPAGKDLQGYLERVREQWQVSEGTDRVAFAPRLVGPDAAAPVARALAMPDVRLALAATRPRPFSAPVPSLEQTLARQRRLEADGVAMMILPGVAPAMLPVTLASPPLAAQRAALKLREHLARLVPPALDAVDSFDRLTATAQPRVIHTVEPKGDFVRVLTEAAQTGGDDALLWQIAAEAGPLLNVSPPEFQAMTAPAQQEYLTAVKSFDAEARYAAFLRYYMSAYFRGGHVFQAKLKIDDIARELDERLAKLNPAPTDAMRAAIKAAMLDSLTKVCKDKKDDGCLLTSPLGGEVLTLRNGSTLAFAGVTLTVGYDSRVVTSWEYPKSPEFAPQLVRVAVEALFDSLLRHPPGAPTSLACKKEGLFRPFDPQLPFGKQAPECLSEEVVTGAEGLQDAVTDVDEWAARADSATTVGIGTFVRGGYWAALNNETVARSVENLGGVIARKVAEHVAWKRTVERGCRIGKPPVLLQVVGG
jgi:hypothetical protein